MFTDVGHFESLNTLDALPDGSYAETVSVYQSKDGESSATVKEFALGGDPPSACDLVVVLPNGDVLFRDFMLLPDGSWRDSYGGRGESLGDLLPQEIFKFRLVSRTASKLRLFAGLIEQAVSF